jgi:hypothetical protein
VLHLYISADAEPPAAFEVLAFIADLKAEQLVLLLSIVLCNMLVSAI